MSADFIERRMLRDWPSQDTAIGDAVTEVHSRGATFYRVSVKPMSRELVVEGWRVPPADQGDLPV